MSGGPRVPQDTLTHEPMQPEHHPVEIWWRIPCWCGWVGCWWNTDEKAWHSYYRHQAMAREWPAPR